MATNTTNKFHKAAVVIPVYTDALSTFEVISLKQVHNVLNNYPIIIAKPESLNTEVLSELAPEAQFVSFADVHFKDIRSYNKLMLSEMFYKTFIEYEYILIHQLDAYIFEDKMEFWLAKGYDYVGAPWIKRPIYNYPVIKQLMKIESLLKIIFNIPDRQRLFNKVGNGGLSLRKIESHYRATKECREIISEFIKLKSYHMYNEDVFWSLMVNNSLKKKFIYPGHKEALDFSFDKHPRYCYKLNNNKLPFGCHGWSKKKMFNFWKKIIIK